MIRSIRCRLHVVALAASLATVSASALADEPDAAATALFRKGRDLVAQGDWTAGCEKLAQSFARQPNASTLLNLARCDEHDGKVATAWARHLQAIPLLDRVTDPLRRDELLRVAREGIARLEPRLPKLQVVIEKPERGVALADEAGRVVPSGEAVPLDPGKHALTARADGYRDAAFAIELAEGRTTMVVVRLDPRAPASPSQGPLSVATPPRSSSPEEVTAPSRSFPWLGVGVGVLGLSLGAVAVGFGVDSANASRSLRARCGSDLVCSEDPSFDPGSLNDRKNTGLGLAIGFGAAGAVALGVATWLLVRPRSPAPVAFFPSLRRGDLRFTF